MPDSGSHPGPYETKDEASAAAAALLGDYPATPADDTGFRVLVDALSDAGVTVGAWDAEVLAHFALVAAPGAVASLAGLIRRAAHGRPA